ncbi:MAG TPA: hypothetical protein VF450_24145 [Noviherbaspirillum sp.]
MNSTAASRPRIDAKPNPVATIVFLLRRVAGVAFTGLSLATDVDSASSLSTSWRPYVLLGVSVANALMHGRDGISGVDWVQAAKVGYSLLFPHLF